MRRDNPLFFVHVIALVLAVVGAVNWGLVGAFNIDLVAMLFGDGSVLARAVYVAVGVAGLVLAGTSMGMFAPAAGHVTGDRHTTAMR